MQTGMLPQSRSAQITVALVNGNPLVLSAMAEIFDRDLRVLLMTTFATAAALRGAVSLKGLLIDHASCRKAKVMVTNARKIAA